MTLAASAGAPASRPSARRTQLGTWPGWLVSWLQVGPLALILLAMFVAPLGFVVVVSFFDYDRAALYPAFIV